MLAGKLRAVDSIYVFVSPFILKIDLSKTCSFIVGTVFMHIIVTYIFQY